MVEHTWPSLLSENNPDYQPAPSHLFPTLVVEKLSKKDVERYTKGVQSTKVSKETQTGSEGKVKQRSIGTQTGMRENERRNDNRNVRRDDRGRTTGVAKERRRCQSEWYDWICEKCGTLNPANWYTCNVDGCEGEATDKQLPKESWHCKLRCGQNNWQGDHYCNQCMEQNPLINPYYIKPRPLDMQGRQRQSQRWWSRGPPLQP